MNNVINNNDLVFCPYNHHLSSPPPKSFRPSSSSSFDNEIFTNPNPKQSDLDHDHDLHRLLESSNSLPFFHHRLPSPYTQFEFDPESLGLFLQQADDHLHHHHHHHHHHYDNEIVLDDHDHHLHPSLDPPLNNTVEDYSVDASETITYMEDSQKISGSQEPPQPSKKRSSKRDRHSKINTARGPRDRRMRLSLEVAREFFGLQDLLGFDKASKTVEWLLTQAKSEIKKLERSLPHQVNLSSCSDGSKNTSVDVCEVVSRSGPINEKENNNVSKGSKGIRKPEKEKKTRSQSRKPVFRMLPKDLRDKARERAKERTKEKMMMKKRRSEVVTMKNNDTNNQLGNSNWSSLETGEQSGTQSHSNNFSLQEMEEPSPNNQSTACNNLGMNQEHIADESFAIINKWSPFSILNSSIFNHHNHGATSIEHQFTDLHFLGKPWEVVYNAQNMC